MRLALVGKSPGVITPVEREAARILAEIVGILDVTPAPDGTEVRFSFKSGLALLDRLCLWNTSRDEDEDGADDEDGGDREADGRDLDKVESNTDRIDLAA